MHTVIIVRILNILFCSNSILLLIFPFRSSSLLKLYCKSGTIDSIEKLSQYINNKDIVVQEGAIVGLLQYGGIDGILIAGKVLNNLFDSNEKIERFFSFRQA